MYASNNLHSPASYTVVGIIALFTGSGPAMAQPTPPLDQNKQLRHSNKTCCVSGSLADA